MKDPLLFYVTLAKNELLSLACMRNPGLEPGQDNSH